MDGNGKSLGREFKENLDIVTKIVNKHDPVGLLPGTMTPDDEYSHEVGGILILLNYVKSEGDLAEGIAKIFEKSFGKDTAERKSSTNDVFKLIASEIFHTLRIS